MPSTVPGKHSTVRREQRGGVRRGRRGIQRVIVLVAVPDAAVPGVVVLRRPGLAVVYAGGFCRVVVIAAGAVGGVPSREVDPVLVVVAGADVDVLGERDDRNGLAAPRSPKWVSMAISVVATKQVVNLS